MSQLDRAERFREAGGVYFIAVAAIHLLALVFLGASAGRHPELWGMALLAYTFGLRHAFDPDHIAAIDNAVRKMITGRCQGAGFYFSLGHSTVVLLLVFAVVFSLRWVVAKVPHLKQIGGIVGTSLSGGFLMVIGILNFVLWLDLLRVYRARQGTASERSTVAPPGGLMMRLLRPMFAIVRSSRSLFFVGFLFGLGFDTASEVGLLALSVSATDSIPWYGLLVLPIAFAAGMSLLDTSDGIVMIRCYRWAFKEPGRRLMYNLSVTGLSVAAAFLIGGVELARVIGSQLGIRGGIGKLVAEVRLSHVGFVLAGAFILMWALFAFSGKVDPSRKIREYRAAVARETGRRGNERAFDE